MGNDQAIERFRCCVLGRLVFALLVGLCSACSQGSTSPSDDPPGDASTSDLTFCVNETNRYRAMRGRPALTRSTEIEAYAAAGAREDGQSNTPHGHFDRTRGGGVAHAENELHRWERRNRSVREVMGDGIELFWSEGPGGGHYENMIGPWSQIGCGVYINGDEITVIQNFGQ